MRFINKYNTTLDFENDKSRRKELDYSVSLDVESGKIDIESKEPIVLKYTTTTENQNINLFSNQGKMDSLIQKCKLLETGEEISTHQYTFKNIGEHEVEIYWKPDVTSFNSCFNGCTGLTSIPESLFANCPEITDFSSCFRSCTGLTSIPESLFANNTKVTDFSYCFWDCTGLTSIPENLFVNCPDVTYFSSCFYYCTGLTGTTPKDSDGGELWERQGKEGYPSSIDGFYCFRNCSGLNNYSSIPSGWK